MKKTLIAVLLVLALAVLGFSAGAKEGPAAADDKLYILRLATVVAPPHPWVEMAEYFAKEVEAGTKGKVKITVHHSSTLGNDATIIDEMRIGTLDFVIGGTQNAAQFVPEFQVFGLSYLFTSQQHFEKAIAHGGKIFNRYNELYEQKKLNLRLLALSGGGTRNASSNVKHFVTPDDLKGIKMRLPGSPIESRLWSALGALPTSLPWNEIYSAVQAGVVNAFESTISGFYGSKLYEVAPYMSRTEHLYMLTHFSMSGQTYNKLPEAYRKVITDTAAKAGVLGTEKGKEFDEKLLKDMVDKYNLKVSAIQKPAFVQKVAPLHDELAAAVNGTDIIKMIRELQ
jgi:tripartite ATP-independent transporter DctP family solute receptor